MKVDLTSRQCPQGFKCSGICAGLKEQSGLDLGLIFSERDAIVGAVFTRNRFPSAHIQYCKSLIPSDKFRALIVNAGNANAATGLAGIEANRQMAAGLADELKVDSNQVFTSSTGIIGKPFPTRKVTASLRSLTESLEPSITSFAEAILTTDTKPKTAVKKLTVGQDTYTITGVAKGSGMIHPNMATMLAYIMTDAPLSLSTVQEIVREAARQSFNLVSVDGDTSTNDSFFLICSNPIEDPSQDLASSIQIAVTEVAVALAKQIAADGEGATHLLEVKLSEAPSNEIAESALRSVLTSNLVKTAIHGRDPNWGRILMAVGNGLACFQAADNLPISIEIQSVPVLIKGEPADFDEQKLAGLLDQFEISININLHQGKYNKTGWGCDLSHDYIRINADYST